MRISSHVLAIASLFVLNATTISGQMFTAHGGFIATTKTTVYAEQSSASKVLITLSPLDVVEIVSKTENDSAIRVKTHKTGHYREPEVNGKFRESGVEVEGWILNPPRENIFLQNYQRAVLFADLAKLQKWSNAATRLVICLHGKVLVGSNSTEVNCALGLPTRTTQIETAAGKAELQEYNCRNQSDTSKCDPATDGQVITLVNGKVTAIAKLQ